MWDSAKKPIKIRSVLQPNGMRHYIVNEEQNEKYLSSQQRLNSRASRSYSDGMDNQKHGQQQQQQNPVDRIGSMDNNSSSKSSREKFISNKSFTPNESSDERKLFDNEEGDFFGIAGSKICNSKKHKGHYSRYFHHFPQSFKENSLLQLQKDMEMSRCPHSRMDVLDLVPVKSPVIKKLISGGASKNGCGETQPQNHLKGASASQSGTQSTTLCSRIMTWIDLEVKRNSGKGRSSAPFPFSSADLNIANELTLPYDISALKTSPSSSSSSDSSSEESTTTCSLSQSTSSSEICLPKLVPCWRKELVGSAQNKVKKSVRIAEDLPRWGKMKRRFGKSNRSMSLNELYDDDDDEELTLSSSTQKKLSDMKGKGNNNKLYSSEWEIPRHRRDALWDERNVCEDDTEEKETDSMVVCDKKLLASGRVQVHIFLPQTDSAHRENSSNLSPRSGDSTS